jgi:hypothetical protein
MYTIIQKIELEDTSDLKYTDYGHTTVEQVVLDINKDYDSTLGAFLGLHRTELENGSILIDVFFKDTSVVYEARYVVDTVEELGLVEITNTNQL